MTVKHYTYKSPVGTIMIEADDDGLMALRFSDEDYSSEIGINNVISQTIAWLDDYFSGKVPAFTPPLKFAATDFRQKVWRCLQSVPYGSTVSYSYIAKLLHSSPRAVGGAIARNPIAIIIPCHRVIGSNGAMTGYAWGLERKRFLLSLENQR